MLKVTRRLGRLSGLIAAGVAIVGTGSVVMGASYSAFSSSTSNATNSWNTGSVALTNDTASAMFSGTNQQMNATGTKCITVTSNGSLATTVKLYTQAFSDTNSLGSHINLAIDIGSGATNATCSGFTSSSNLYTGTLAAFNTGHATSYVNGLATTWIPTGSASEAKQFRFVWSYDATAPQSSTATATFTWEAQGS
ncbi:hypothetical protein [uncultured Amnibacterium sp.]|uniref:hypothetical protein n=1 Tax=uncultured Amnibacterium sp. TaxID=1631851 RepID=UPI0035CBB140